MACVYPVVTFPEGVSEEEAIKITQSFLIDRKRPNACINYYGLKTIWVKPDSYKSDFYEPCMIVKKEHVVFETVIMPGSVWIK